VFVRLLLIAVGSSAVPSLAQRICTRDFASDGRDICASGTSPRHKYVEPEVPGRKPICAITYDDKHCKFYKAEFAHAKTVTGQIVCVLNFNQPYVTGNQCVVDPNRYMYVSDPWL